MNVDVTWQQKNVHFGPCVCPVEICVFISVCVDKGLGHSLPALR